MSTAPAAKKAAVTHPKYIEMIVAAVTALKERSGSSRQAILKYVITNYNVDEGKCKGPLKNALRRGVKDGAIMQTKGIGASGSFKIVAKAKPAKPAKKAAAKKPAAKKTPKKAAAKKVKRKPAAKKVTKKKPAAKKPAAKKVPKKKPAKKTPKKKAGSKK